MTRQHLVLTVVAPALKKERTFHSTTLISTFTIFLWFFTLNRQQCSNKKIKAIGYKKLINVNKEVRTLTTEKKKKKLKKTHNRFECITATRWGKADCDRETRPRHYVQVALQIYISWTTFVHQQFNAKNAPTKRLTEKRNSSQQRTQITHSNVLKYDQ